MDQNLIIFICTRWSDTVMMQMEKEVMALLSKLDLQNVTFAESPPGMFIENLPFSWSSQVIYFWLEYFFNIFLCWNRDRLGMIIAHLWYLIDKRWYAGDANQSVHLVASEGLEAYLPLANMVDISAEVQRLTKRLAKMQTEYDGLMARLSSPSVSSIQNHLICYL